MDATGQQALIANALGLRVDDPRLRKAAIWGYYRNARRDAGRQRRGHASSCTPRTSSRGSGSSRWRRQITSIGVVGDTDYLLAGRRQTGGSLRGRTGDAARPCGSGWQPAELVSEFRRGQGVLLPRPGSRPATAGCWSGDAFGFIDPIYSSGVFFALKSGELAADAVIAGLRRGDTSAGPAGRLDRRVQGRRAAGSASWSMPSTPTSSASGTSSKYHPEHRGNLTDLLIGRVFYDGAGRIFDDMQPALEQAKSAMSMAALP